MSAEYKPKSRKKWLKKLFGRRRAASPAPSATLSTDIRSSDQGNAEHGSKAPSIVATESCAPPSPSAAAAKAAQPRTDARVPNDHQPPAASQALPPALPAESAPKPPSTESTEQLTPVLSVSERLWNAAYDSLETDNADRGVAPDTNIPAELHNPTNRQTHVRRLVEEGQARIPRAPKMTMRLAYGDYTIAWICALPLELAASRAMLDEQHLPHPGIAGDDNTYVLGRIHRHNVVMACLPGQYGTNNAAIVATNLKRSFPSIRATLMVGIAGGCPSQADLYLGDVVVGTKVIQYDMGKALGDGRFQETAIPKTPAPLLNSAVSTLQSTYVAHQASDRIAGLLRSRLPNISRPDHLDRLFQASYEHHHLGAPTCDDCDPNKLQPRAGRRSDEPQIHYGVIASANRVMRNGKERDEIAGRHSALCFEMEAAGMMDNVRCLPIRGICDYSDSHKDKVWQDYAAATAAAYARELLEVIPTIPTTHWDFISSQKDAHRDDIESACRRDLRVVDPQHDMERIENNKDELLDDAYKWILRTPEYADFTNWDDSGSDRPPRRLLWIKGHAGTGKTMLMIGLIRQLSHQPVALSPALSFFFCQGTDTALNNATAVLRSLIWLLLLQQPCLISHLLQKYKESGADLFRDQNAFIALSEAFRNMLKDPQLSPVYLAVDALDECARRRSDLIHLISTSLNLSQKVRWLLSSRPEVDLLAGLKEQSVNSFNPSNSLVELDTQRLEEPVNAYINHKLMELKYREGYDGRVLAEVSYEVRQRAENTFLWVALVFKELSLVEGWDAVETVQSIPPGLTDLYGHMMARIDEGNKQNRQRCKNVLAATFLVHRPLLLSELVIVAGLLAKVNPRTIVDRCGSFLTIKDETVYLIHQSAKDYLGDNYATRLQPAGPAQGHSEIVRRSINAMSSMLRRNIYDLEPSFNSENMAAPDPDPLAPIRYSCIFWADHLCSLNSDNAGFLGELTDDGKVFGFLKECFLRWLESLSLIGKLSSGLLSIRKILSTAQSQPEINPDLLELLKDAEKFVFSHRSIIERAPLQIYGSALVFSPTLSEIRKRYWKERLCFIETTAGTRDHWGAHRQTLEGHDGWVNAVAFSPDGKTLASASGDRTIRLWDTATGAHRQTLEGHHGSVRAVAFSPDGKYLETDRGLLSITVNSEALNSFGGQKPASGFLSVDDNWVTIDGKRILWLPADYRATCVAVHGHTLILGHSSGRVTFFRFAFTQ